MNSGSGVDRSVDWQSLRIDHPALSEMTYLDTSSCGLIASSTAEEAHREQIRLMTEGSRRFQYWMTGGHEPVRRSVADSIGGAVRGVALVPGFSVGMAQLTALLKHRSRVLLVEGDYPTLHAPFERGDHEIVWFRPGVDGTIPKKALEATLMRERPDILAVSHVQWRTGYSVDLSSITAICRENGILTVIDATQSWGSLPIDVEAMGIDILGASGYKWPLAGFGNGFMYISEAASNEIKERSLVDPVPAITGGHNDPVALVRLAHALERMERIGITAITERVIGLFTYAVDRLDDAGVKILNGRDPIGRAGILMIEGDEELLAGLKEKGVQVALRGQGIRIGIHYYNSTMDIDRLVEALNA